MPRGPRGEKRPSDVTLKGISPAMASGLSETLWSMTDLAEMVDAAAPKPGTRGSYKKGAAIAA
jgi:hypothetical protein